MMRDKTGFLGLQYSDYRKKFVSVLDLIAFTLS